MKIQRLAAVACVGFLVTAGLSVPGCAKDKNGTTGRTKTSASAEGSRAVPEGARFISQSSSRLTHRVLRDGTIYIVDGETNKVMYSGPVKSGANIVVDPAASAVTVNDQQVKVRGTVEPRHNYKLYYQQS